MRPQQKSFVVEIKSKGRLSTVRQGSIWGTTDLKALAKQAATVAPQLFDGTGDVTASEVMNTQSQDTKTPAPVDFNDAVQPESAAELELVSIAGEETETPHAQAVSVNVQAAALRKPKSRGRRRARKRSLAKSVASEMDAPQPRLASDAAANDDLALLEDENIRLKSLWAERLRGENRQLRAMLERFFSA